MRPSRHRDSILRAATVLFAENGYENTSTVEIAHSAGSAEATVFHHFKSKEELFLATFDAVEHRIVNEVEANIRSARFDSGLEMVRGIASLYFHLSQKMRVEFLLLFQSFPYQLASKNEECGRHLAAIFECFLDVLAEAIEMGVRDGSIKKINPQTHALIVFSTINGLVRFSLLNLLPGEPYYPEAIEACARMLENTTTR
jgi:AcrR family transcriptional regulator